MAVSKTHYNAETKIWRGPISESRYTLEDSIGAVVLDAMHQYPDHVVQLCHQSGKEITNKQMAELACSVAINFSKLNLQQTDVVGVCSGNCDYVAPFCDGVVYDKIRQCLVESGLENTPIYTVCNHIEGVPTVMELLNEKNVDEVFKLPPLKHGARQDAFYLCTSGSTNLPNVVRMSHYAILYRMGVHRRSAKLLVFSGVFWFMGIVNTQKTRVITENPFSPQAFCEIVQKHKIEIAACSPSHIPLCLSCPEILAASDLTSLKTLFVAGKTLPYSLVSKFKEYAVNCEFPIVYGMTELCGAVSRGILDASNKVGQLVHNVEVRIVSDNGENLGPNETGEIYIRTKYASSGYYCNPEASRLTYIEDGWIRSGDIGYFNDEGNFYVVDRRKDILKYNNFHFSPTAIETVIYEIPDVAEVCVVGIPDITYDSLPAAAIVKRQGANITEADVSQYVAKRMQHFENLDGGVYFFDKLPLTASGKVLRKDVTDLCAKLRNKQ
ncbi:uncharacterized protein LOC133334707 [Musca vetustissima]|uniref:uncharacterized protein LOC133334707 n=1 Tax=Musca vetustissima TaxID=27455 RepID=UPI002AB73168|nr:uncharacterized protein LOC133334707 [Musca vetustissima]